MISLAHSFWVRPARGVDWNSGKIVLFYRINIMNSGISCQVIYRITIKPPLESTMNIFLLYPNIQ